MMRPGDQRRWWQAELENAPSQLHAEDHRSARQKESEQYLLLIAPAFAVMGTISVAAAALIKTQKTPEATSAV